MVWVENIAGGKMKGTEVETLGAAVHVIVLCVD